jgi:deoxyadenosine/deoxycytidine kinase
MAPRPAQRPAKIAIVGPCGAGKSTLAARLQAAGYHARQIAQEHSYVPDMWRQITDPDVLIFLDASFPVTVQRKHLDWRMEEYLEQQRRLAHARAQCTLYLHTDELDADQVYRQALAILGVGQP